MRNLRFLSAAAAVLMIFGASPAVAQSGDFGQNGRDGLILSTPYPAITAAPGQAVDFEVSVRNDGTEPARLALSLDGLPEGWLSEIRGDGRPVGAVFVSPEDKVDLDLRLEVPEQVGASAHEVQLTAVGDDHRIALPLSITVGDVLPPQLSLDIELPALRGTPTTKFTYKLDVENGSGRDEMVSFAADAPPGFQIAFRQTYGKQELTTLPVAAGETEGIAVDITPPQGVPAGEYQIAVVASIGEVQAQQPLLLDIVGQPALTVTGADGRMSGEIEANEKSPLKLLVYNDGSAPARDITFSARAPADWTVEFDPERVDMLPAGQSIEVAAIVEPAARALAGDYMLNVSARAKDASDTGEFRLTMTTSTMWGIVGVIAAAVVVLGLAVTRFGRR